MSKNNYKVFGFNKNIYIKFLKIITKFLCYNYKSNKVHKVMFNDYK